jgi:hypothetical protein
VDLVWWSNCAAVPARRGRAGSEINKDKVRRLSQCGGVQCCAVESARCAVCDVRWTLQERAWMGAACISGVRRAIERALVKGPATLLSTSRSLDSSSGVEPWPIQ